MSNNYFKVFSENTSNENILSDLDYSNNNERDNGFQKNTTIRSSLMNTVLRQCSLITLAITEIINEEGYATNDIGPNMEYSTFKTYYSNFMNNYYKKSLGFDNLTYGVALWNNDSKSFTTITSPNQDDVFVLGTNKTNKIDFINWNDLKTGDAEEAKKVTQYIGNQLISNIFESNGLNVKNATNAVNINGGTKNSLVYQYGTSTTKFIIPPTTPQGSSGISMLLYEVSQGEYSWSDINNVKVGNSYSSDSSDQLSMKGASTGSIPYKSIYEEFGYINPPTNDENNDYILVSKFNYIENTGMIPEWVKQQKITVVENEDGTVDVTITNI